MNELTKNPSNHLLLPFRAMQRKSGQASYIMCISWELFPGIGELTRQRFEARIPAHKIVSPPYCQQPLGEEHREKPGTLNASLI